MSEQQATPRFFDEPCRRCGTRSEAYTDVGDPGQALPSEGHVIFCFMCGEISLWRAGRIDEPSESEHEMILEHPEIARVHALLMARIAANPPPPETQL